MKTQIFSGYEARKLKKSCIKNKVFALSSRKSISSSRRKLIEEYVHHNICSRALTNYVTMYFTYDERDAVILRRIFHVDLRKSKNVIIDIINK